MSKHTPGPWVAHQYSSPTGTYYIRGAGDARVLGGGAPLHEADARLIAAAPELLDALKAVRVCVEGYIDRCDYSKGNELLKQLDAALAKAGGQP